MRQGVNEGPDEIILRSFHDGRHHDRKADPGRYAGDRHQRLAGATADVRPGDGQNQFHGAVVSITCERTREPFLMFVVAGEATSSPSVTPSTISTKPVPRMPISTLLRRARPFSIVNSELLTTAFAGTRITSGLSRLTIFASTLIPTRNGVSSGRPTLTRKVFAMGSPAGVICLTKPGNTWLANASVRSNAFWPT